MALEIEDLGNRIIISGTTDAKERVKVGPMVVTSILWRNPTISHKAIFVDENEKFEFGFDQSVVGGQPMSDDWPMGHATTGDLYCNDLDSGEVIIYYKSHA